MTSNRAAIALLAFALLQTACGDDDRSSPADSGPASDTGGGTDAGPGLDAGPGVDSGGVDSGTPTDGGGGGSCGTARPDILGITGTEGLVIARDGTVYYSQSAAVGRMLPDGTQDDAWSGLPAAADTVWGLALDAANTTLYAASPSTGTIYSIEVATATATPFLPGAGQPNGMTMGPDGALYYSDFGGGGVYRVDTAGTRTPVTTSAIMQPNGVAFGPDGRLYVESYSGGTLVALTLTDGAETARDPIAMGLGNPDGLAFDADGRIYVGDNGGGRLYRLEPDGTGRMTIDMGIGSAANVEFGHGVLPCTDIYVASGGALARYEMGTAAGAAVPWH